METDSTDIVEVPADTPAPAPQAEPVSTTETAVAHRDLAEWQGRDLVDRDGERIGKLDEIYFDVETDEPQFGTVREGLFGRRLAFVPLAGVTIGPNDLQVPVTRAQIKDAPIVDRSDLSQEDESRLYHHYELNYTPIDRESGRRLARR